MPLMPGLEPINLFACLDIGQVSDPTALVIMEREMLMRGRRLLPRFLVRYMERVPLMTPYPLMVEGVKAHVLRVHGEDAQPFHLTRRRKVQLLIDQTGVGRPVVDMFRAAKMLPIGITLTRGETSKQEQDRWDEWHVSKQQAVMTFQVTLQQGRFQVARSLPDADLLAKEAQNFQWKRSKADNDLYGAWREGQHDDLLLACVIGVWWGTLYAPIQALEDEDGAQRHATGTGNPLFRRQAIGGRR